MVKERLECKIDQEETKKVRRELSQRAAKLGYGPGECSPEALQVKLV